VVLVVPGACSQMVLVEPGSGGGQIAFLGPYLVNPPYYKLSQSHEGVWEERGGVGVGGGCGVFGCPLFEEQGLSPSSERVVGPSHEWGGWDICVFRGWGVEDRGEAGEPRLKGEGELPKGVDREVDSDRWGRDTRAPVQGKVA